MQKKQIKKYRNRNRDKIEIIRKPLFIEIEKFSKKYDHLSENELNAKHNKDEYAKNDVITTVIKRCRDEK